MSEKQCDLSRREALIGAGKLAVGAAVLTLGTSGVVTTVLANKPATFPWGYKKIDPQEAGNIAYENWYKGFCCFAVVSGILQPLQREIGEPYSSLPLMAFKWGHGGAVGWGTLCGSLNGAGIATGLIGGHDTEPILNDVIAWYTETQLPIYKPKQPKAQFKSVNASASPLCHISVGKWMKKEGVSFASPQRKDRCARLSADIAMKTVTLLNDWKDGKYKPTHGSNVKEYGITSQENCMECHGDDVPSPKI
ncbi:MAG: C-GCAxxG-C-C family protein [Proteobacteria bacterium]|nr:C-GCAxxG-C-C family protein [Pseudomonadota bacterium]MBU1709517.1 C-GCAxxG-C-C family protein [Pseudomonadota bacterium]